MHYEGTLFDIKHVLRELNDNVARLTLANIAILDELHMIRRAVEGDARAYDDPYASILQRFDIPEEDAVPKIHRKRK